MNNLLKVLASFVAVVMATLMHVSCSDDGFDEPANYDIVGKVFVQSSINIKDGNHEDNTTVLCFYPDSTVVRYNMFCYLIGDYITVTDLSDTASYRVEGNAVTILRQSDTLISTITESEDVTYLRVPMDGLYTSSDMTVRGHIQHFERIHDHASLDPLVKPGDSLITVAKGDRYVACIGNRSYIMSIDSVSGSHETADQYVSFRVNGIPGSFSMSEADGTIYLMKFGSMGCAPIDKSMADMSPKDIVFSLCCDGSTPSCTFISPILDKSFAGEKLPTRFAKLNDKIY